MIKKTVWGKSKSWSWAEAISGTGSWAWSRTSFNSWFRPGVVPWSKSWVNLKGNSVAWRIHQ
jgi:hypothetical protein